MSAAPTPAELAAIVPGLTEPDRLGQIGGEDAPLVVQPSSAEEVSALLRAANQRGWAVVVRGGGTKPSWGRAAARCDLVLETSRLNRLVEHEPGDLICVAGAGMRLQQLQEIVSQAPGYRQRLMLDPPQGGGSTLGGLIATRAHGPLRPRYGTMRDLLLGAQFVLPDGTIARTGGKVVKNVAGYDLDKLLVGSLGSLGVVVEVALRLHPVPDHSQWVLVEGLSPDAAARFCSALRLAPAVPSLVEVLWPERSVLVRVDSSEQGCRRQAEVMASLHPKARVLDQGEAAERGNSIAGRPWGGPGVVAGLSVPLTAVAPVLELAESQARSGQLMELSLRGTIGTGEARLDESAESVTRVRQQLEALGGHLSIHRAPAGLDRLGSAPADPGARRLMMAVKRALDPADILAPGRLQWEA